jgi:hypothetical protein
MTYAIISPPFTLKFREMSTKELEAYGEWFCVALPDRISELAQEVKLTVGFEKWEPNLSVESLSSVGAWFFDQVKLRPRTDREIEEIKLRSQIEVDVSDQELTTRTFSLAMDIAMYFGEVIRNNVTETRWKQVLKNKRLADYGQMVIVGSGSVPLNPVRVLVSLAYGITRKHHGTGRLRELFDTWSRLLGGGE